MAYDKEKESNPNFHNILSGFQREHDQLEKTLNERLARLECKIDSFISTMTTWMLGQECKVAKIDGKLAAISAIAGAIAGALASFLSK